MKNIFNYLLIISCLTAYSQEKETSKTKKTFMLGVNAGGHYSYLGGGSTYSDYYHKNKFSYAAGINAELQLDKDWSLYANLNYRPRGFKATGNFLTPQGIQYFEEEMRFSYLELPVMAKYRIPNSFFYLNGGPYFAKFLSVKDLVNGNDTGENWNDSYNKLDIGLVLGAGFIFYENEKETTNLSLEVRYIHGLTDMIKESEDTSKTIMNAFCLQLNYNFTP